MQVWSCSSWGWNSRSKSGWSPRTSNCCCQLKVPGSIYLSQRVAIMQTYSYVGLLTKYMSEQHNEHFHFNLNFTKDIQKLFTVNVYWCNRRLGSVSSEAYQGELAHFIDFFSLSALISFRRITLHVENKQHCTTWFSSQTHAKHHFSLFW